MDATRGPRTGWRARPGSYGLPRPTSEPAAPRHAHRAPSGEVHEVNARGPAEAVGARDPARVRREGEAGAVAERANRLPDLLECARVQRKSRSLPWPSRGRTSGTPAAGAKTAAMSRARTSVFGLTTPIRPGGFEWPQTV